MLIELFNINSTSFITFSTGRIDSYCKGNAETFVWCASIMKEGRIDFMFPINFIYVYIRTSKQVSDG